MYSKIYVGLSKIKIMRFLYHKICIIIFVLFCLSGNNYAQTKKPVRAEIETKSNSDPFYIANINNSGVFVINRLNEFFDRKTQNWSFTNFDHNLNKRWIKKIPLNVDLSYQGFDFDEDTVYFFFHKVNKKADDNNLTIIAFDKIKNSSSISNFQISEKTRLTSLKLYNHFAYFTSKNKNRIFLNIFNFKQRLNKEIDIDDADEFEVEDLEIDTINNKLYIVQKKEISKRNYKLVLKEFDLNATLLSVKEINSNEEDKKILTANLAILKDGNIAITGSYNLSGEKTNVYNETTILEAAGMYYVKINKAETFTFNYFNFLIFNEINKYLNKREIAKIKKLQESKEKEFSLNYMLVEHDLIQKNGRLILLSEAFYPEYRTVSDMSYDYYGRMVPTSRTIFDGFRYTNAFILCLDEDGNIIWNNLFDIWNIISMEVKERVSIMPLKDEYVFAYNNEGELVYKTISDSVIISEIDNAKLELPYSNDKIMENQSSNIEWWYDNYYLCYGIQIIKNNALANKSKRTVFYLNKIIFE